MIKKSISDFCIFPIIFAQNKRKAVLLFSTKLSGFCKLPNHEVSLTTECTAARFYSFFQCPTHPPTDLANYKLDELCPIKTYERFCQQAHTFEISLPGLKKKSQFSFLTCCRGICSAWQFFNMLKINLLIFLTYWRWICTALHFWQMPLWRHLRHPLCPPLPWKEKTITMMV